MIAEYYRTQERKERGKEREKNKRQLHFNCLNFTLLIVQTQDIHIVRLRDTDIS